MTRTRGLADTLHSTSRHTRHTVVGLVVVAASLAGLFSFAATSADAATPSAPPAGYFARQAVADSFNRTVQAGWGSAPVGGPYDNIGRAGKAMTLGGNAYLSAIPAGRSRVQRTSTVVDADSFVTTSLAITRIPSSGSWTAYTGVELRTQANGSGYTVTVRVQTHGRAALLISRQGANGRPTLLHGSIALPTMVSDRSYTLQAVLVGTRIWARVWAGRHAPAWTTAVDSSTAAIRSRGSLSILMATDGSRTTATARYSSVSVWTPMRKVSKPPVSTPPVTTPPVTTPPVTTPPVTPPPVTPPPVTTPPVTTPPVTTPPVTTPPVTTPPVTTPPVTTPPVTTPPVTTPPVTTPPVTTPPVTTPPVTTPPVTTPPVVGSNPQHAAQVMASAGSLPVGSATYAVPTGAIYVATNGSDSGSGSISSPFATVAQALRSAAAGATIVLRGGVYHQNTFVKAAVNATIENYPGEAVWFDGSVAVSDWTQVGSTWVHAGWTTTFDHSASFSSGSNAGGFVNSAYPMAAWPDQVFVDGSPLQQVAANPSAGEFAVDYSAQQIVLGSDPSGHAVRASDLTQAFVIAASHVTLRGFGVRNYATPLPLIGTIYVGDTAGPATFENLLLTHNATTALATNNKADTINHVTTLENGMGGMGVGHADGTVVSNCRFERDNIEHFNDDPASAGIKVGRTDGIVIKDNYAVDGIDHAGIWTDENVVHFAITGNVVTNNGRSYGIENELSGSGIVANNTISGSNYGYTAFDSGNISIYNNEVDNNRVWDIGMSQDNRWQPGKGTAGPNCQPSTLNPWLVQNNVVANNLFGRSNGSFQVYVFDKQTNRPADSMNLLIAGNQFAPRDSSAKPYAIGWGLGDNRTVHTYATPDAFNAGESKTWVNAVAASSGSLYDSAAGSASIAVGLPSDVADAIGQAAGTQRIGAF